MFPSNFAACIPLLAAVAQGCTWAVLFMALSTRERGSPFLDYVLLLHFIALLPAISGLAYGCFVVVPRFVTLHPIAKLVLIFGLVLCALFVAAFANAWRS